jgi:hypothetical protein
MSKRLSFDIAQEVYNGVAALIQRPEFQRLVLNPATQAMESQPVYASVEDYFAQRIVRDGLMAVSSLIPAVAMIQTNIGQQQQAIAALLTPEVVAS